MRGPVAANGTIDGANRTGVGARQIAQQGGNTMRRLSSFGLTVALILAAGGTARSAPPPNDACENATPVTTFPYQTIIDTTEATQDPGQGPICDGGGGPTVCYAVTPSFTGRVCVKTCGLST